MEDIVARVGGSVRVVLNEVLQKAAEVVVLFEGWVATRDVGLDSPKVEVVGERVNVGQVFELFTLVRKYDGQLKIMQNSH